MTGPTPRFDVTAPLPSWADLGHVHLVAIGGAGMSAVARLLLARGLPVSGCDAVASPTLHRLAAEGARVHVGHSGEHVASASTLVVSSAVRDDNPDVVAARARGVRVLHRAQALRAALGPARLVAVAGANGKTTTTAMVVAALEACGADPSFAVGGEFASDGRNAHLGQGDLAVVEADESDGSFLVYRPEVAVVTSVQPDHLDYYGSFDQVVAAYREFVTTLRPSGTLVVGVDDPGAAELAAWAREHGVRVIGYGQDPAAEVRLTDLQTEGSGAHATLAVSGRSLALGLRVPGRFNLLDASAAVAVAVLGLDQPPESVLTGLAGFTGARRRFEFRGAAAGVRVVDDYAHNPGKVAAVVETARALVPTGGRLVVVFQPHLYSRTRDFAAQFGAALAPADLVVVMDVYAAREDPVPSVTGALVADAVGASGSPTRVCYAPRWDAVAPLVASLVRPGDLLLTVGAGDVTRIGPLVLGLLAPAVHDEGSPA